MPPHEPYWLLQWLRTVKSRSRADLIRVLESKKEIARLQRLAADARSPARGPMKRAVVAGRGADMSEHGCMTPACRRHQIDDTFRRVWFYFDEVVLADCQARERILNWDKLEKRDRQILLAHISDLVYLDRIGASNLAVFAGEPLVAVNSVTLQGEPHLKGLLPSGESLVRRLLREGKLTALPLGIDPQYPSRAGIQIEHAALEVDARWLYDPMENLGLSEHELKAVAVSKSVMTDVAFAARDIRIGRTFSAPVGSFNQLSNELLRGTSGPTGAAAVALAMDLPVLRQIPVSALIDVRNAEGDAFERFRIAVRKAVAERAAVQSGPEHISKQIYEDLIEPALFGIRTRLQAAQATLGKKAGTGAVLGTLATTCGLLAGAGVPVAVVAGIAALSASLGPAAAANIDKRAEIAQDDMYFLWLAAQHSPSKKGREA